MEVIISEFISEFEPRRKQKWLIVDVNVGKGFCETSSMTYYPDTKEGYETMANNLRKLDPMPPRDKVVFREIGGAKKAGILDAIYGPAG